MRELKHAGKQNQIGCKIKKEIQKEVWKGGGGATMCHNMLLPSKVAKEWCNIPIYDKCSTSNFYDIDPKNKKY